MTPNPNSPDQNLLPVHSVCFSTEAGRVFLAEFRTHTEALVMARDAAERLQRPVTIRRCGEDMQQIEPMTACY